MNNYLLKIKVCLITLFLSLFFFSCTTLPQKDITDTISIIQDNEAVLFSNGMYQITEKPFDIIIENITTDENINIFAYHSDEMFNVYTYPIETEDTEMFAPGTVLAMAVDESKEFFLRINKKNTLTYITAEKRINNDNQAVLKIKGFADSLNRYSENKIAYISIFIDYNKNQIVESNEVANIIVKVNPATDLEDYELAKVHISTMGVAIEITNENVDIHNDFILYKITNDSDAEIFLNYIRENTNYYTPSFRTSDITEVDYSTHNMYFLMTPKGLSVTAKQPYHYSGDYDLIFDINNVDNEVNDNYVSLRRYKVDKANDIFSIKINWRDQLITPVHIESFTNLQNW